MGNSKPLMFQLNIEKTDEEQQEDAKAIEEQIKEYDEIDRSSQVSVERLKVKSVNKFKTPLYILEDIFISNQKGKNNTDNTIKYYQ